MSARVMAEVSRGAAAGGTPCPQSRPRPDPGTGDDVTWRGKGAPRVRLRRELRVVETTLRHWVGLCSHKGPQRGRRGQQCRSEG